MNQHLRFGFRREDEGPDARFYAEPRLVTHIDEAAIAAVTQLYREYLPAGGAVLDLMSSWVSHLPADITYSRVVGLGMNRTELAANPRLDAKLIIEGGIPATEIAFDHPVVTAIQHATSHVLGKQLEPAIFPGATDAYSFQEIAGIPSVAAFGPGLVPRAHSPNEHLAVSGVYQASRIYALSALKYLSEL